MNVALSIEQLVLDGIDLPHDRRPLLQAAVEGELARLLATHGLGPGLLAGGALPGVEGGAVQLAGDGDLVQLGQQIAQAVYEGIGR